MFISNHLAAVLDSTGKFSHGIHPGNKSRDHLEFFAGLRETLSVTLEEGTWPRGFTIY